MKKITLLLTALMAALLLSSGMAVAATISCKVGVDCFGTKRVDTLKGTAGQDHIHARGGGDTVKGFAKHDEVYGQLGADRLFGGPGSDYLIGGAGNDALGGGRGDDWYLYGDGWGKDTLTDEALADAQIFFSGAVEGAPATENLIVDLRSGTGPEAKDASGTNTVNWKGNVVDTVYLGAGDDQITGNAAANKINGQEGDDRIYVNDGFTNDTVHCGAGEDTVYYDSDPVGVISDSINVFDCEHPHAL
jgi:Ca2+-binding RTX toxin-like protein